MCTRGDVGSIRAGLSSGGLLSEEDERSVKMVCSGKEGSQVSILNMISRS